MFGVCGLLDVLSEVLLDFMNDETSRHDGTLSQAEPAERGSMLSLA